MIVKPASTDRFKKLMLVGAAGKHCFWDGSFSQGTAKRTRSFHTGNAASMTTEACIIILDTHLKAWILKEKQHKKHLSVYQK